jgi:membrane protein involved in colicin uptake
MSIDFNRAALLLRVVGEAVGHGAAYRDIVAEANFELTQINDVARQDGLKRAEAIAKAEASRKAEEQARADELAAEAEAKLKADAQAEEDAKIKTQAQVLAAAKAKAEADAKAGRPVDINEAQPAFVDPATTFTSDNGRRI